MDVEHGYMDGRSGPMDILHKPIANVGIAWTNEMNGMGWDRLGRDMASNASYEINLDDLHAPRSRCIVME